MSSAKTGGFNPFNPVSCSSSVKDAKPEPLVLITIEFIQ